MRISADGRVTLPAWLRRETGPVPGVEVTVELMATATWSDPCYDQREADVAEPGRRPSA